MTTSDRLTARYLYCWSF